LRLSPERTKGVEGNVSLVGGVKAPGWEYLHSSFVYFEIGCLVKALVGWVLRSSGKGKGGSAKKNPSTAGAAGGGTGGAVKEEAERLSNALKDLEDSLKDNAKELRNGLGESGVLGRLVDVALAVDEGGDTVVEAVDGGENKGDAMPTQNGTDKPTATPPPTLTEHENQDTNKASNDNENSKSNSKEHTQSWARFKLSLNQLYGDDEALVETLIGRWRESWEDSLDGIVRVKVRLGK
jgi:hypothetical protein